MYASNGNKPDLEHATGKSRGGLVCKRRERVSTRCWIGLVLACAMCSAQQPAAEPKLKTRDEVEAPSAPAVPKEPKSIWVVPAGTKIPIQLRQPVSTKNAQPGDAIYAQTSFPVVVDGEIPIPAGT